MFVINTIRYRRALRRAQRTAAEVQWLTTEVAIAGGGDGRAERYAAAAERANAAIHESIDRGKSVRASEETVRLELEVGRSRNFDRYHG